MKRQLTGYDAGWLAILALAGNKVSATVKNVALSMLHGEALKIAKALVGMPSTKATKKVAEAFKEWANSLGSGKE